MSQFNFILILLIGFVDYLGIALVYPVFAALVFDVSNPTIPFDSSATYRGAMLGILIGLTPITQFFSSPILGMLSDIKGRKKILVWGCGIGGLGYLLAVLGIWWHSLSLLFVYRILIGISEGTLAVGQAAIADMSDESSKAKRFALFNASLGTGFSIGPFIGGKLADPMVADWCGYSLPFMAAGFLCVMNVGLVMLCFPETLIAKQSKPIKLFSGLIHVAKVFSWSQFRCLFLATFAFSFGWSFFNEFVPVLMQARFQFTPGDTGNYYAYGGVWYALCAGLFSASILKRCKSEKVILRALVGSAFCMLLYLMIPNPFYLIGILPLFMFCLSLTYPANAALVSNRASAENQGEILGAYYSVMAFAMGLSPIVMGSLVGEYPFMTAVCGALAMLIAAGFFWLEGKTSQPLIMSHVDS